MLLVLIRTLFVSKYMTVTKKETTFILCNTDINSRDRKINTDSDAITIAKM